MKRHFTKQILQRLKIGSNDLGQLTSKTEHRKNNSVMRLFGLVFFLFMTMSSAIAQPAFYNINTSTGSNAFPLSSTTSNKVQWIYGPNLFKTAGTTGTPAPGSLITKVYFRISTATPNSTFTNFTISLSQNVGTANTWTSTTFVTGMTQCFYSASHVINSTSTGNWVSVTLNTPFAYDPSKSLAFEMKQSAYTAGLSVLQGGSLVQRNYGAFAATTGTISSPLVDFGFDIFKAPNDVGISALVNPSNLCGNTSDPVIVQITNNGSNALSTGLGIGITTVLSGTATGTYTSTFNRALAIGASDTVHMTTINTASMSGNLSVKSWTTFSNDTVAFNDTNLTVLPIKGKKAARSGTYTVGGASPDYATLNDAFNGLECDGISGPVVFNVRPGVYNAKVVFPNVPGSSSTNTITVKSTTGNPMDVVFTDSASSATTANKHTFLLNGVSNYIIRDVTIQNIGATYGFAVHMINNCSDITLKNCRVIVSSTSTNTYCAAVVVNGGDVASTAGQNRRILIDSNYISGGYYGIVMYGNTSSTTYGEDNTISNNRMENTYYFSIWVYYQTSLLINNNDITQRGTPTIGYGIYALGCTPQNGKKAIVVTNNKLFNLGNYGIFFSSCSGTTTDSVKIFNNQIAGIFKGTITYGIYSTTTNYVQCYHNTVFMKGGTSTTYGIYTTSSSFWDIRNNIFSVDKSATAAAYAAYILTNTSHVIDFNNYYNPNGTNLFYRGSAYNTTNYKTAAAGGANSSNLLIDFVSDINLNLLSGCSPKGTPISSVVTDKYGKTRSTSAPFLGAHEGSQFSNDAGAVAVLSPNNPINTSTSYDLKVVVRNYGTSTITSLVAGYELNGVQFTNNFNSLNIASCDTVHLVFTGAGQVNFSTGVNLIRVFTGIMNGASADADNSNDTTGNLTFCGTLSGTLTINPAVTSSTNFKTFAAATTALYTCGISSPVTINVAPGIYNEQVELNGLIPGSSPTNTVKIDGINASNRVLMFSPTVSTNRHIIKINGTKYITIANLGLVNNGATFGTGIWMTNNGSIQKLDSNSITGCTISLPIQSVANIAYFGILVSSSATGFGTVDAHNLTFINNTFVGGYYGIAFGYALGANNLNNKVINNEFNGQWYSAIFNYDYSQGYLFERNKIINLGNELNTSTAYGIYNSYNYDGIVNRNTICNQNSGYGIYMFETAGSSTARVVVSNNVISIGNSNSGNVAYGIYADYNSFLDIVNNTVNTSTTSATSYPLYFWAEGSTYPNNRIANNNLVNDRTGYAIYLLGGNTNVQASFTTLNNNNYFTKGLYPLNFNGTVFTNPSQWANSTYVGSTNETNSKVTNPNFVSLCNVYYPTKSLDSAGITINTVTTDFNGITRNSTNPDIGAFEFNMPANNIKVLSITAPNLPVVAGTHDVKVEILNEGTSTLTSANINYQIGKNGSIKTIAWTGTLASGNSTIISFTGSQAYTLTSGLRDTIIAFTNSPNNVTDEFVLNDTITKVVCEALSGIYTIGGSGTRNYSSLNAAVTACQCGALAPVTFNMATGTYNEQVEIKAMPGVTLGSGNRITFQSASNNASDVKIAFSNTNAANNFIVKLNSADLITFRSVTFDGSTGLNGQNIVFASSSTNGSDSVIFDNAIFTGVIGTSTGTTNALIFSNTDSSQFVTFKGCNFRNGSYGMYFIGYNIGPYWSGDLTVENCVFDNVYYMPLRSEILNRITIRNNTFNRDNAAYTGGYLLYLVNIVNKSKITENRFIAKTKMTYPVYFSTINTSASYLSTADTVEFSNNFISYMANATSADYSLFLTTVHNLAIVHNSINCNGLSTGIYHAKSNSTYKTFILNNNIASAYYTIYNTSNLIPPSIIDNNNLFSTSTTNFAYNAVAITSFAAWKSSLYTGSDFNSISINPNFVSATDLHTASERLVDAGFPLGLTKDIDGDARNMSTPVIGADEYIADVQVASISGPAAAACNRGSETVTVKLRNVGKSVISNINLAMEVNGGTAVNETFTGSINPGDSANYTFTATADLSTLGNNTIKVTSSRSIDYNTANNTSSLSVLHAANPMANFTHKDTCFGGTVMFTNSSSVAHGTLTNYAWDFDNTNTSTATNPSQAFAGVGPYNVKLTATSSYGCVGSTIIPVNILSDLMAGTVGGTQTICYSTTPTLLTNSSSASGSGTTYNYQWQMSTNGTSFTDITGATNATYQPGVLTFTTWFQRAVSTNLSCGPMYSNEVKVTVHNQLVAGSISGVQTICYNSTPAQINGATNPTGGDGSFTHRWESSSNGSNWFTILGATGANYSPSKLTSTTYFRRTDIGGSSCGEKQTNVIKVTVYDDLTAGTFANNYDICPNTSPGTINQTSGAAGGDGTYTFQWQMSTDNINWSNISGATSLSFTPGALSVITYYKRNVTSGSSCGNIEGTSISVQPRPLPHAAFTTANHCFGDVVPLVNTATPGFGSLSGFNWDFGNGYTTNVNTPNYIYPTGGSKTIKLVVTNSIGCKDSSTKSLTISNIPNATFSYVYDCNDDTIRFKNTTSVNCGKISAYFWDFGTGITSTLENPVYKFAPGTYNVKYIIYLPGGFADSITNSITVYNKAVIDFTAPDVCYNDVSMFTNTSTNAGQYLWKFGDNNTSNATNPNHLYATSNTYQVTLQAVSLNGCNFSVTKSHVVKVRPDADIVSGNRCLGDTIPFGNGSIYAHNYNWSFGDGTTSTMATPMKLYGSAGTYSVKLVATNNNGCVDSTTSSATIYSLPTANFTVNNTCFGTDINFTNTSTGSVSSAWNMGDGSSSATTNPVYRYATMGTYTVGLQVTSGFGCKNSTSKTVTVYPKPSVSFTTSNVCSGTAANFTNTSSISAGSIGYNWTFGDGQSSTSTSPSNTYAAAGVYNVKLVGTSGFGCSDSTTNTISIYTSAIADFSTSNSCLGTATNFSNMSQNANTYAWDFGDGRTSTQANPSNTYASVGTYTVKLTANNGNNCSSVISKTVQVNALPSVSFTGNNVCQGTATTFTNSTTGATSYSWDFGDGTSSTSTTPTRTYGAAGTYTVRLTATSGSNCSSVGTRTVQVYANPIAGFNANSVCAGTSLQFVNTSSGAATYAWNFGDATTSTTANPTKTYGTAGSYTVTLTVTSANNCTNIISKQVTIYATPVANFSNTTECQGVATVFTNSSTGATSYNWTFGDGNASTTTSPNYMYGNAGTYNATLVAINSNGCKNQTTKSVTVNSKPAANFSASNVCLGSAVNFTNSTTGATSYNWSFGDATTSTSASPSKTYASAGVYTVTLTATNANNCNSIITKQVSVYANPTAGFSATEECIGKTSVFTNSSTGAVLYNWNFGDGTSSPLFSPTKAYSTAGAYTVTLTATNSNGCSNVTSKTVNAFANPTANFSSSVVCTDNTTQLTNTSTGATSYSWNFGDGGTSTAMSPSKTYAAPGTYVVTLTSSTSNNCKATVQNTVVVSPAPVASFSANEVCLGAATQFNNTSTNATSASWTFGDATTSTQLFPSHTYATANSFTVNLSVMSGNGCTSNASKTVVVNANPTANFTASNACQGNTVNISNTSSGADSYEWYYGLIGPDMVMTPNVSLNNVGTTTIRLVAITNKGCKSETSKSIEIYSKPIASFEVLNTCAGDQTRFVNKSLSSGSYNWQFGDGNNSGNSNPSHQYAAAGSYSVTLTANNAQCSDAVTKSVVVNALPSSDFTFGTSGKDVLYTSGNKTNVTSYGWNFGDGSTGTNADPKHTYNNAVVTVYNVCLTVVDNKGCQSETCKPVSINLLGKEEITMNNGVIVYPNPNQGSFKVKVGASQDRAAVVVYNLLGVKVADAQATGNDEYAVNAAELSAGTYMVKVTLDGKTSVHNVVITR